MSDATKIKLLEEEVGRLRHRVTQLQRLRHDDPHTFGSMTDDGEEHPGDHRWLSQLYR